MVDGKKRINWKRREQKLLKLLDKHRGKYGEFDCIVPGSGGKDSCFASLQIRDNIPFSIQINSHPVRFMRCPEAASISLSCRIRKKCLPVEASQ